LSSRIHHLWFRERCSTLETRLRYTADTVFDSFPWPQAPESQQVAKIADLTGELLAYRLARLDEGAYLADMYDSLRDPGRNVLRALHDQLDQAVMDAFGFNDQDDVLTQLLALNESIALEEEHGVTRPRGPGSTAPFATTSDYAMPPPTL
jgi:hypothetical protein